MHDSRPSHRSLASLTRIPGDAPRPTPKHRSWQPPRFRRWSRLILPLALLLAVPVTRSGVPEPIARWTFDGDARDSVGMMHGELLGDASIVDGRLVLKGSGHVRTAPLDQSLAAKTLVARVKVDPLEHGSGGVMAVETVDGYTFDSIVYGGIAAGKWNAGSPGYIRSQQLADAFPEESSAGMVQMAITYADDGTISLYRNGLLYGRPYQKTTEPWLFGAGTSEVLFGRNSTAANPYLRGEIDEAALYDRALTAAEVAELAGITPGMVPNLITNGGFEFGSLAPWQETLQPQAPTLLSTLVTESMAQGRFSLAPGNLLLSQRISTDPGREYVLAFAYAGRGAEGSFRVLIGDMDRGTETLDSSFPSLLLSSQLGANGIWAYASRRFTATASTTVVAFDFSKTPYVQALLDDVRVYPAETQEPEMTVDWSGEQIMVREGESATVTVRRSGPLDQRGFAAVELRPGTATVSDELPDLTLLPDLTFLSQALRPRVGLTFLPGQAEVQVTLRGRADSELEPPETATLHLLPTGNASVRGRPIAVTVVAAPTRITASGYAYEENAGNSVGWIILQVDKGSGGRVRVQTTAEGTAMPGVDFLAIDQELNVIPGSAAWVPIQVLRDNLIEGDETIGVRITPVSDQTEVAATVLSVPLSDDLYIEPVADSPQVSEAVGAVRFSLVRRGSLDSPQVFHVRYRLEGREGLRDNEGRWVPAARPGQNFQVQEGVVEFGPGISRQTVELPLLNNTDADGPHGLTLRLEGSPEFPTLRAQGEAFVIIADDEHEALRQNIRLMNSREDVDYFPVFLPASDGGTLIVHGRQIFRLTPAGVPDLHFGKGDGQMLLPTDESWRTLASTAVQAPDGGVMILTDATDDAGPRTTVHRLTAEGTPSPSFGNGTGKVTLTNWAEQVLPIQPNGYLALVRDVPDERRFLQRLDSNGSPEAGPILDPLVSSSVNPVSLIPDPSGNIWVLVGEAEWNSWDEIASPTLRRLLPDGQLDTTFGQRDDISRFFGFDSLGRSYFGLKAPETVGDPSPSGLIRFLPDGTQDQSYRPATELSAASLFCQVLPNGSTILTQTGNVISEFDPDGRLENRFDLTAKLNQIVEPLRLTYDLLQVTSAARQTDGSLAIGAEACLFSWGWFGWSRSCYELRYLMKGEGSWRPIYLPDNLAIRRDVGSPLGISWGSGNEYLWRFLAPSVKPQVGLPATGLICRAASVRIPVQRSGSTADRAEVRGRMLPWVGSRWNDALAISFVGKFPVGSADTTLDISLPDAMGSPSIRDYLVQLESADGLEVSSFNECRVWVLDESFVPQPGELTLLSPNGPNPPETSWLLAYPPDRKVAHLEVKNSFQDGRWFEWSFQDEIELGPVIVRPISHDASPALFYRLTY